MLRNSALLPSKTLVLGVVVFLLLAAIACGTTATATPVPPAATNAPESGVTPDSAGSPTPVPTVQAAATPNPTPVKIVRSLNYVTVDEPTGLDFTRGWGGDERFAFILCPLKGPESRTLNPLFGLPI